jgi:hypothetical protein
MGGALLFAQRLVSHSWGVMAVQGCASLSLICTQLSLSTFRGSDNSAKSCALCRCGFDDDCEHDFAEMVI